jgi:hypothetical protein
MGLVVVAKLKVSDGAAETVFAINSRTSRQTAYPTAFDTAQYCLPRPCTVATTSLTKT